MNRRTELQRHRETVAAIEREAEYLDRVTQAAGRLAPGIRADIERRHQRKLEEEAAKARASASVLKRIAAALELRLQSLSNAHLAAGECMEELSLRLQIGELSLVAYDHARRQVERSLASADAQRSSVEHELREMRDALGDWDRVVASMGLLRPALADPEPSPAELSEFLDGGLDNVIHLPDPTRVRPPADEDPFGLEDLLTPLTEDLDLLVSAGEDYAGRPPEFAEAQRALDEGNIAKADAALVRLRNRRMDDPLILALLALARVQNTEVPAEQRAADACKWLDLAKALDVGEEETQGVIAEVRHHLFALGHRAASRR